MSLKCISEADIQIYGIHGEGDCMEIVFKDVVQSPSEVCIDIQIDENVDQSIRNLTRIGSQAMNGTDRMVLDIMVHKEC